MKKVLFLAAMLLVSFSGIAQAQSSKRNAEIQARKENRKIEKQEQRALETIQDSLAFNAAVQALKSQSFVLEATNVVFRNGLTRFVSSNTNFVSVNNGEGIVQTAFNNFIYSPNGIGGVTVQGTVSGVRWNQDKDGNIYYDFNIQGIAISATISIVLTGGTNQASVNINPNYSGNTLMMTGNLVPYDNSNIFQGTRTW